jgi:hypothetical protein
MGWIMLPPGLVRSCRGERRLRRAEADELDGDRLVGGHFEEAAERAGDQQLAGLEAAAQRVLRNTDPAKTRELLGRLNS